MRYIDHHGPNKPIDIFKFLLSGEYDSGDTALVSYDDLYDMIYRDEARIEMMARLKFAYENLIHVSTVDVKKIEKPEAHQTTTP